MLDARLAVVLGNELRVEAALRELEVTPEVLRIALEAGYATAALCTSNHPPNFGGMTMWAETVRSLREQLIPAGWHRDDAGNFSTVVNGDGALGIAVASGNADTGQADRHPTTRYPKGPVTYQAVERNAYLPFDPPLKDLAATAEPQIWLLLHNRTASELRSELSFPVAIDDSGFVAAWGTRLILPPIDLEPATLRVDEEPVVPDIKIGRL